MRRRRFLATAAAALGSGCTGISTERSPPPNDEGTLTTSRDGTVSPRSGSGTVSETGTPLPDRAVTDATTSVPDAAPFAVTATVERAANG